MKTPVENIPKLLTRALHIEKNGSSQDGSCSIDGTHSDFIKLYISAPKIPSIIGFLSVFNNESPINLAVSLHDSLYADASHAAAY